MGVKVIPEYDFVGLQGNGVPRLVATYVQIEEEGSMETYPAKALFHKELGCTDKESLGIMGTERVMSALTLEERKKAESEGFVELPTVTPLGIKYNLVFNNATISGQWLQIYCDNNLNDGDWVFGLGYRRQKHLCITLTFNKL